MNAVTEAAANPDADRILLLAQIVSLRQERDALSDADEWAPDKGPLHARYAEGVRLEREVDRRLYHLGPPETPAGVQLVARVAWDIVAANLRRRGIVHCEDFGDWLVMAVLQGVTGTREEIAAGEAFRDWLGKEGELETEEGVAAEATAEAQP